MVLVHFLLWAFVEYQENNHCKMETLAAVISEGRMVILLYENGTHLMHIHKNLLKSLQHGTYNVTTLLRQRTLISLLRAFFPLFSKFLLKVYMLKILPCFVKM